jgi:hypothetical protein
MTSLACFSASAQRSTPADLLPALPAPAVDQPIVTASLEDALPDAPTPNYGPADFAQQDQRPMTPGFPPVSPNERQLPRSPEQHPAIPALPPPCLTGISASAPDNISCAPKADYFQRFVDSGVHPLTARQKARLAFRNTTDPYNFATIAFLSGLSVATDPNSPYGPGMPGFSRNFGVAYCETAVGEFFGTFLIPAIAHEDPHYHRIPNAPFTRRVLHAITGVVWAQSDYGVGMPNYSTLIGSAIGDGLGNLYVPGRQTDWGSTVDRYTVGIASAPIGNFVTEFLPDVAQRVNIRIVLVQRVIDRVERGS